MLEKIDSKILPGHILVCPKWGSSHTGVYIEIPLDGIKEGKQVAALMKIFLNKWLRQKFSSDVMGSYFNMDMRKAKLYDFDLKVLYHSPDVVSAFSIEFHCPTTYNNLGNNIGMIVNALNQVPTKALAKTAPCSALKFTFENLNYLADILRKQLKKATMMIISKDDSADANKISAAIAKKFVSPAPLDKAMSAPEAIEPTPSVQIVCDVNGYKNPFSLIYLNGLIDGHIQPKNGKVAIKYTGTPGEQSVQMIKSKTESLGNARAWVGAMNSHAKISGKVDKTLLHKNLLMISIGVHLPMSYVVSISKKTPDLNADQLMKDVQGSVSLVEPK
jgi:hypothetical protein